MTLTEAAPHDPDTLSTPQPGPDFYTTHPATRPTAIPLGYTTDGDTYTATLKHTVVSSQSTESNTDHLCGILYQLAPFIADGSVRVSLADPRDDIAHHFTGTDIFHPAATTPEDTLNLIDLHYEGVLDPDTPSEGRIFPRRYTPLYPLNILVIADYADLILRHGKRTTIRSERAVAEKIATILLLGAPAGHIIIAYNTALALPSIAGFPIRVAGRLPSAIATAKALSVSEEQVAEYPHEFANISSPTPDSPHRGRGVFTVFDAESRSGFLPVRIPALDPAGNLRTRLSETGLIQ